MLPQDSFAQAEILQWLFLSNICMSRLSLVHDLSKDILAIRGKKAELAEKIKKGYQALDVMETHLHHHDFLCQRPL